MYINVFKKIIKLLGVALCAVLIVFNYIGPFSQLRNIASDIHIKSGETYILPITQNEYLYADTLDDALEVSSSKDETLAIASGELQESSITISLMGIIPVKQIDVHVRDTVTLVPGGSSIGVTLHTKGALVVGVSSILLSSGEEVSPASAAGIQAGDLIEKVNGVEIRDAAHLSELCNETKDSVTLTIKRDKETITTTLKPALDSSDNKMRMGMWVRDGTAGVGTLSFYDPEYNWYAALGHAITDVDTRSSLTVRDGEIFQSTIVDIIQGTQGEPGELRGTFGSASLPLGTIEVNSQYGIYGKMYQPYRNALYQNGITMAYPEEAVTGPASILTTLSDSGVKAYDCNIIKVNPQSSPSQKGMVIEITDEELLEATGGIVQGMSGSPIVQNSKLIGVVTHVFINDPTKGYCMYALWMRDQLVSGEQ